MKLKFTYKELTLLLGILVAVIIMITLWVRPFSFQAPEATEKPIQKIGKPAAHVLIKKAYVIVTETLK